MSKSKKIGIVGWKVGENSFGATLPYLEFISNYGIPIILHPDMKFTKLDLLVLPGGPDIDVKRYNGKHPLRTGRPCPVREYFDRERLPEYIEQEIPIFGICRGMQSLAVTFGAKLIEDMYHETSEERYELVHKIRVLNKYKIALDISNGNDFVNSLHHQVVSNKNLPDCFDVTAIYVGSDHYPPTIEGLVHKKLPIAGVQYHPEELVQDELADKLIINLLEDKTSVDSLIKGEKSDVVESIKK